MISVNIRTTTATLVTPDHVRGRVGAVEAVFVGASNQLGAFESGAAAALLGAVPAVVLGGALTIADRAGLDPPVPGARDARPHVRPAARRDRRRGGRDRRAPRRGRRGRRPRGDLAVAGPRSAACSGVAGGKLACAGVPADSASSAAAALGSSAVSGPTATRTRPPMWATDATTPAHDFGSPAAGRSPVVTVTSQG